jgi:putative peptide zinc metalloprotease protein
MTQERTQEIPPPPETGPADGSTGPAGPQPDGRPPRLADGVDLIGRFEDSGFKEPPFIARRADGQMIQLPGLLYVVAEHIDGHRTYGQIAEDVSHRIQRGLDPDDVRMLVEEKLHPLGITTGPGGAAPQVQKQDPFLALKLRAALIPKGAVRAVSTLFKPFFFPPVILAAVAGLVAVDIWLFLVHGVAQSMREMLYQPVYLIGMFGMVVIAAALHEIGHATACRYGGAQPGVMGAGIYIVWPAFYTDVTDAYRLGKGGRLRTDLGGVYFNALVILATGGIYFLTSFEPLLILMYIQHLEIIRQLLPMLRLDGYLVLSDLTGVPDLFMRMKPILVSMIPGKKADARVTELKPWVRTAVTLWVLAIVPFLAFNIAMILVYAPRIFATGWNSFWQQFDTTQSAFASGEGLKGAAGVVQLLALGLPAAGIAFGMSRTGTRLTRKMWSKTSGRPLTRTLGVLGLAGALALLGYVWWPDGDYTPIRPGERWTLPEAASAVAYVATGSGDAATVRAATAASPEGTAPGAGSGEAPVVEATATPGDSPSPAPTDDTSGDTTGDDTTTDDTTTESPAPEESPVTSETTAP